MRVLPSSLTEQEAKDSAEWICAGYNGDGMPGAWLAAKGLSTAIPSTEDNGYSQIWSDWFPDTWAVSAERPSKEGTNSTEPVVKARQVPMKI